jgi:hypothetical protein
VGEESPKLMSASTGAVFLSYASEDVTAAERIAGALRAAGIDDLVCGDRRLYCAVRAAPWNDLRGRCALRAGHFRDDIPHHEHVPTIRRSAEAVRCSASYGARARRATVTTHQELAFVI